MKLIALGMLLIIVGVIVAVAGVVQLVFKTHDQAEAGVKAGGVILIGPIPLVVGSDRSLVILSIAGAVLFLIAYFVWRNR